MKKRFVICEINEEYLEKVKKQMKNQKMPLPKDDMNITIAHKPLVSIQSDDLCDCKLCRKIRENL
ncbi:MAG: hypothetical protein HYW24_00125 [Candidatus Aenigmarchaeota archaeon]|nr:hypothetical protein [Candidatus Aenigmarchaeota archaeon]